MPLRFRILAAPAGGRAAAATGGAPARGIVPAPEAERTFELIDDRGLDEIRVGRRMGVEIELPFPAVSTVHARLFRGQLDGDWWVEDLDSTNGSWLDGQRLSPGRPRSLRQGQRLRFGTVDLIFEGWSAVPHGAESTATLARRLIGDLLGASAGEIPTVTVEAGAAGAVVAPLRLVERKRRYVVGRGGGCDLAVPLEHVSREHAAFERGFDGVTVHDLGSKNGISVNGRRVAGQRRMADGDRVEIGSLWLRLSDPEDRYRHQLANLADAPLEGGGAGMQRATQAPRPASIAPRATPTAPFGESTPTPPMPAARGGADAVRTTATAEITADVSAKVADAGTDPAADAAPAANAAAPNPAPERPRPTTPIPAPRRRRRSQRALTALALGLILAAVAGLLALLLGGS